MEEEDKIDANKVIIRILLAAYADEPCRICGKNISYSEVLEGAVFAGYSNDGMARSAHKECWSFRPAEPEWIHK